MLGALVSLLIWLIIAGVLWWGVTTILAQLPIAEPFATIIRVLLVFILVIIVCYALLGLLGTLGAGFRFPFAALLPPQPIYPIALVLPGAVA